MSLPDSAVTESVLFLEVDCTWIERLRSTAVLLIVGLIAYAIVPFPMFALFGYALLDPPSLVLECLLMIAPAFILLLGTHRLTSPTTKDYFPRLLRRLGNSLRLLADACFIVLAFEAMSGIAFFNAPYSEIGMRTGELFWIVTVLLSLRYIRMLCGFLDYPRIGRSCKTLASGFLIVHVMGWTASWLVGNHLNSFAGALALVKLAGLMVLIWAIVLLCQFRRCLLATRIGETCAN